MRSGDKKQAPPWRAELLSRGAPAGSPLAAGRGAGRRAPGVREKMAGGHLAPGGRPGCGGGGWGSGPGLRAARPASPFLPLPSLPPRLGKRPRPALCLAAPRGGSHRGGRRLPATRPGCRRHPRPTAALPGVGRGGTGTWVSMAIASRPGGAAMTGGAASFPSRRSALPGRLPRSAYLSGPVPPSFMRPAGAGASHFPLTTGAVGPRDRCRRGFPLWRQTVPPLSARPQCPPEPGAGLGPTSEERVNGHRLQK